MWLGLLGALALAGVDDYQACAERVGGGPGPTDLQAVGPGSQIEVIGGAHSLVGVWTIACAGTVSYAPDARTAIPGPLEMGTVITGMNASTTACFDAACRLPPNLCIRHEGDRVRVVHCIGGAPPAINHWQARPTEDTAAVVLGDRVIKAERIPIPTDPGLPAVLHPPTGSPAVSPTPQDVGDTFDKSSLDLSLPAEPPNPCIPNVAMRKPSAEQVDAGNAAAATRDWPMAVGKYRAAITIDECNAFAWADLGEALIGLGEPGRARTALQTATRLMPKHYRAWTNLGAVEERLGRKPQAAEAYRQALAARSGYPPAEQGLLRVDEGR